MQEAGAGVSTVTTPGERHRTAPSTTALHMLATCDLPPSPLAVAPWETPQRTASGSRARRPARRAYTRYRTAYCSQKYTSISRDRQKSVCITYNCISRV